METLAPTDTDIDTFTLIVTENWDAPHCESRHLDSRNQNCTHIAVAYQSSCKKVSKVCQGHVDWHEWARTHTSTHTVCGKPWADCVRLHPLGD